MAGLLYDFWCHPERRANECVAERFDVSQLSGNTEICQLDLSGLRKKDVCGFDVSVKLSLGVKVGQAKQQLSTEYGDVRFFECPRFELWKSVIASCVMSADVPDLDTILRPGIP